MNWLQTVAFLALTLVLTHILLTYSRFIEPFADGSTNDAEDVTNLMTSASECFCPAIDAVLDTMQNQYSGTDEQKRNEARIELTKEAKGPLFPCPVPSDPLATPVNIDQRIITSTTFLEEKLVKIKDDAEKQLSQCPGSTEGFDDICTAEDERQKQDIQAREAATQATKQCVSPKGLSEEDKQRIYQSRAAALKQVMQDGDRIQKMARIKSLTTDIKDVKQKAESGQLQSSCPS